MICLQETGSSRHDFSSVDFLHQWFAANPSETPPFACFYSRCSQKIQSWDMTAACWASSSCSHDAVVKPEGLYRRRCHYELAGNYHIDVWAVGWSGVDSLYAVCTCNPLCANDACSFLEICRWRRTVCLPVRAYCWCIGCVLATSSTPLAPVWEDGMDSWFCRRLSSGRRRYRPCFDDDVLWRMATLTHHVSASCDLSVWSL